jgi:hypothetical protein
MVRSGARQLISAENAVEMALVEVATLASSLGRMRLESDMSLMYGQDAMSALVESITLLSNARGAMIKAHGALNDVKAQMGCRTVMDGQQPKPDSTTGLLVVASTKQEAA